MIKQFLYIVFAYLFLFFCSDRVYGGGATGIVEQKIYAAKYDFRDGLPSNNILECVRDEQQGIWLRTLNAVSFFCGTHFLNYSNVSPLYHLRNYQVNGLTYNKGYIYVVGDRGIERISTKHKTVELLYLFSKEYDFRSVFITRRGQMILVTFKGDVYHLDHGVLKKIISFTSGYAYKFTETRSGEILISNGDRYYLILDARLRFLLSDQIQSYQSNAAGLVVDEKGDPVFVNGTELLRYVAFNRTFVREGSFQILPRKIAFSSINKWMVSGFNTIVRQGTNSDETVQLNLETQLNLYINEIVPDHNGQLILCTNQGLWVVKKPLNSLIVLPPTRIQGLGKMETRRALLEDADHNIIQIGYNGISAYNSTSHKNTIWLRQRFLGYAACLTGHTIWIGTDGNGLCRFDIASKKLLYTAYRPNPNDKSSSINITSICTLSDTLLLVGSDLGRSLVVYNSKRDSYRYVDIRFNPKRELAPEISHIALDKQGHIWIASSNGITELSPTFRVLRHFSNALFQQARLKHILIQDDRSIFIASNAGMFVFDAEKGVVKRMFNQRNGLSDNQCVGSITDHEGYVWVPTYKGLNCIDLRNGRIRNYYMQDGFADNEYNRTSYLMASTGQLYAGGLNGYIQLDPIAIRHEINPKMEISITRLVLNRNGQDRLIAFNPFISVPLHRKNDLLKVYVGTTEFVSPEYTSFFYRIKGLQEQPTPFDPKAGLLLSRFPSGDYSVLVEAIDAHGKKLQQELILQIHAFEYWYESTWFYTLILSMLSILVLLFFIYRKNALKKIGNIRVALSNDIHDEVGTLLTKTVMKAELLKIRLHSHRHEMEEIEKNLREAVHSFRNVLWALNTELNTVEDLTARIKTNLSFVFENTNFEFIVTQRNIETISLKSPEVKRNILFVVKETALNTLKYSNGNLFEVVISYLNGHINIFIADNGKNDPSIPLKHGVGLTSIHKRVINLGGRVSFTKAEKGFFTEVKI